ncbi:hypothetical protein [Litoreibacter arenae]|uniref:Excinuclease ABC subunit A n=1 Tax=Litoreibacter arenae DSM 19593 TaxID=1123360 RepID=S9RYW2_9RHOB|nr:hypothetical protein [Litoreibacter arenae]EPX79144.1 hypothetical protein thalar_01967 [Litoreibacter arenae DSM 19593]
MFLRSLTTALALLTASAGVADAGPKGCPPGLAKKDNGCLPPGQAKKSRGYHYKVGDYVNRDYVVIRDRGAYGMPPLNDGDAYIRVGDNILRVDRETRLVLDLVRILTN